MLVELAERLHKWIVRATAALLIVEEADALLEAMSVRKHLALQANDQRQFLSWDRKYRAADRDLYTGTQYLLQLTGAQNVVEAKQFLVDVSKRYEVVEATHANLMQLRALVDVFRSVPPDPVAAPLSVSEVEARLQQSFLEYQMAVEYVRAAMPLTWETEA